MILLISVDLELKREKLNLALGGGGEMTEINKTEPTNCTLRTFLLLSMKPGLGDLRPFLLFLEHNYELVLTRIFLVQRISLFKKSRTLPQETRAL